MTDLTAEQQKLFLELTDLQKEIALNYIAGMSAIDAVRASSSKCKNKNSYYVIACNTWKNPKFKAFMDSMDVKRLEAAILAREDALKVLSRIAATSLSDLVEFGEYVVAKDEQGRDIKQATWRFKDSAQSNPENLAAISELSATKDGIKIKTHSPLTAIKQLAEMQDWEAPKKILTSTAKSLSDFYNDDADEITDS